MNLTSVLRRAGWSRAVAFLSAALLANSLRADMFHPQPRPGGIDPHPTMTSLSRDGTNTTVGWYGLEGGYHLQRSTSVINPNWTNVADTLASDYSWNLTVPTAPGNQGFFRVNPDNGYVGSGACSSCHSDKYNTWQKTPHASALSLLNGLPPNVAQNCIVCHTVGYGQPTGFVSAMATPNLTDVGCENCHGPGAAHKYGDHQLVHPAWTIASETCGGCHDGSHHPTYSEWTNSMHAAGVPEVAEEMADPATGQARMMSCGPCHSGATRLAMLENLRYMQLGYTNPLALPTGNDASCFAQTCTVCHDPHATNGNPYQLRNPITSTNFYTFRTGAATNQWGQYMNTVFATQYVATVQICAQCHNSRGASWTSNSRPPHHSSQYNLYLGNVGELADGTVPNQPGSHAAMLTNQCVTCHMQQTGYSSETNPATTGHSFKVTSLELCGACHSDPAGALQFGTNAVAYQVQQVKAGLDYWALTKAPLALQTKYGARAWEYTNPGDLSTGGPGPSSSEQASIPVNIRKARYNMYLVHNEGSGGMHNPLFAISLLDTAYNWVQQELAK